MQKKHCDLSVTLCVLVCFFGGAWNVQIIKRSDTGYTETPSNLTCFLVARRDENNKKNENYQDNFSSVEIRLDFEPNTFLFLYSWGNIIALTV